MLENGSGQNDRPLRILTIDNGGLQALSVLHIVKPICQDISEAEGCSTRKAPYELFDIIAGIGTGGWLAILLGRCRLDIDLCMLLYINIAKAVSPKKKGGHPSFSLTEPAAISQEQLIDMIEVLIAEENRCPYMVDSTDSNPTDAAGRRCYAFAVGAVKPSRETMHQKYRLFRAYEPPRDATHKGPDPAKCKVSKVCAATAAARDFVQPCTLDGKTYWDSRFPLPHNVSDLALDEARSLFGKDRKVRVLLNISPGLPTEKEIDNLRVICENNATPMFKATTFFLRNRGLPEATSPAKDTAKAVPGRPLAQRWTWPPLLLRFSPSRALVLDSTTTCSSASEKEQEHHTRLKSRLKEDYGDAEIYQRLAIHALGDKPYLDDVDQPEKGDKDDQSFLAACRNPGNEKGSH